MTKLIVAAICAATMFTSKATADEVVIDPDQSVQPQRVVAIQNLNQDALQEALLCKTRYSCGMLSDEDRAKAAMALLFLRISENCSRKNCTLRLVKVR